ncbi:MAG TPA: NUDIX domain-containing protein [Candidatus Saccharimonadales bacterium]|nr:NUDIX domain-containing protein [Candidatus Saccharimonadales bacterium]
MLEGVAHPSAQFFCGGQLYEGVVRPSALLLQGERFLTVRHKNEDMFCLPGGKCDIDETEDLALIREVGEETRLSISELQIVQRLKGILADGQYVQLPLYLVGKYSGFLAARGEIAEIKWVDRENYRRIKVASMIRTHIIPGMIEGNWQAYVKQYPSAELTRNRALE